MAAEPPPPAHDALDVDALDVDALDAAFEAAVLEVSAPDIAVARSVRVCIGPDRYALEWHLSWWIGRAWGVAPEICAQLSLGNVVGLAALRLRDDLEDGEVGAENAVAARRLSDGLLQAALAIYGALFPPASPLWPRLDAWLAEWHDATRAGASVAGATHLAARAAPVKASAYGACLIGGRGEAFSLIEGGLDSALQAMVLFDHLVDWQQDTQAKRWNAFVAHACGGSAGRSQPPRVRDVYRALLSQDVVGTYGDEIDTHMRRAVALMSDLDVPALEHHLVELNDQMKVHAQALRNLYLDLAGRTTSLLGPHAVTA